jgi:hypothetical protein
MEVLLARFCCEVDRLTGGRREVSKYVGMRVSLSKAHAVCFDYRR